MIWFFAAYQDRRKIRKRVKIVESMYTIDGITGYKYPGMFRKHNLDCSCGMCDRNRPMKHKRVSSGKEKAQIKAKSDEINLTLLGS